VLVVDDHILFRVLTHRADSHLEGLVAGGVVTTSSWYFRLARAISSDEGGALSRQMRSLTEDQQSLFRDSIDRLPSRIQTIDPRDIVPLMASIATVSPSNFLTLEAIATAIATDAEIATATATPLLQRLADRLHITVHIV
jgi:hypothetical protein